MRRILVTGASGFLGWNLYQQRPADAEWLGTFHHHAVQFPGVSTFPIDLTIAEDVSALFREVKPDIVIHAAAISDANWCEQHPSASHKINVEASVHIANLCKQGGCRFVLVSSDLVFDGTDAPYLPEAIPNPVSLYGKQKASAEHQIRMIYPESTIARVPLMYGANGPASTNHLSNLLDKWRRGEAIALFTDEFRTPADGGSVARGLYLAHQFPGEVLHLGGPERISRFDFGLQVAASFGLPIDQLKPLKQADLQLPAPRPQDVSLDSSLAFAKGYRPGPIVKTLLGLAANWV